MNFNKIFNWKKYPASVFYVAGPLALLIFALLFARALIEIQTAGRWGFLLIDLAGVALLLFALWPIRRFLLTGKH